MLAPQLLLFFYSFLKDLDNKQETNQAISISSSSFQQLMGNYYGTLFKKRRALPIETPFKLPSPLPSWPQGGGFAKGSIDLGGLEVRQISAFTKVWATHEGGQDNLGATFFNPSSIPTNFYMLGSYVQPNNKPLFGWILVAKDTTNGANLAKPVDFTLVWSSESLNIKQDGNGYIWLPVAPVGYKAIGHVVTSTPNKPSTNGVRCVLDEFTENCENGMQIWSNDKDGLNVYGLKPATISTQSLGVWAGTFSAQPKESSTSSNSSTMFCLKNNNSSFTSSMPNLSQILALIQTYSPLIYFHPDEIYLPSSVSWFFKNGALLYQTDSNSNPTRIYPSGSNLPQGGSNDGKYWIDLPVDNNEKDTIKKGDLASSKSYAHAKPMLGGTFTDIAIWVFYPFNGPARAKVEIFNIKLGRIGEHVGDWEHVTLRISNWTGELWRVYFSEHGAGTWVDASQLEYQDGNDANKFVAYASLNGHAFYPKPGLYLQGNSKLGIGIRNDADKGKDSMDVGVAFEVVAADYLEVVEPPWLNYMREWGPKITYDIANELKDVERFLPKKLRRALENFVRSLPAEILGEEGPTGPKEKASWTGDENS